MVKVLPVKTFSWRLKQDSFADSVVEKVGYYLGLASANISNILNPDSVVIGGVCQQQENFYAHVLKNTL